jgi:ABC-type multidrug transport system fused ATPase/permease subunit
MSKASNEKKELWRNIVRLILPHRSRFFLVVTIGLLATGASLVEPLIYREAINDVAGLFVQNARDDTRKFYESQDSTSNDAVSPADSLRDAADSVTNVDDEGDPLAGILKSSKEPHSRHNVAPRTPEQAIETLLWAVGLLLIVNLVSRVLTLVGDNLNVKLACHIEQSFIQRTFEHVLKLPLFFFSKRSSAAISKRINQSDEVTAIVNGFSQQILPEIISLTGILVIMFWQNVTLTLIALAVIPFYIFLAWRSAIRLESGLSSYYDRWEEVSARIQDVLGGIKTVKLSGSEKREAERLREVSVSAYNDFIKRTRLGNRFFFLETMLTKLSTALVLGYGGYLTLEHQLTPGDVVMFVAYLDRLYDPIDSLASLWVNLQQNIASVSRAFKLLDNTVEEQKGIELTMKEGKVEFRNVHFSYSADREILKGISFTLEPGKVTAIVGTSGAGKTTTVDLLLKLYHPMKGEILIDGQNLAELDASSVRRQIGMVMADGAIFRGTLADNIRYKWPKATDTDVKEAVLAAGMEGTLQRLTEGLETPVGESGLGLSAGEKQRIQIARVFIAHPKILILDEATANLDYATEAEVKRTINHIRKDNTVVVIAHRYSMVRDADLVIVLSAGKIIEHGSPSQLISKDGWFAKFAAAAEKDAERLPG